jgi:hypothetical protein
MTKVKKERVIKITRTAYLELELLQEAEEITRRKKTNVTRALSEGLKLWVDRNREGKSK